MTLEPDTEASVLLPPRSAKSVRMRLLRVEPSGDLTFIHPKTGGLRTVHPDAVRKIYKQKVEQA